ncbi:serine/threonine protein kinase [Leptospira perolatii]|uniref:Serine/threonine protein kinase n=1 Tax=Leptospira perolatii TaxID=2023191 RepID=A0A2M9ZSJ8_9LEPT|nr:aminoglycoside phosphotransferase family protein [Leptospira perolatii]PJZ71517.1 serine/threonine protein kinase [Leptospira perolatii]PJZ75050.1 serine/threonine protein kinase [Leptospira perolatii]
MSFSLGEIEQKFVTLDGEVPNRIEALTPEASARRYFRIYYPKRKLILSKDVQYQHDYVEVSKFLQKNHISVPQIIKTDESNHLMLLSDAGEKDLTSVSDDSQYRDYLMDLIQTIARMQELQPEEPVINRLFDYEKLNYENQFTLSAFDRFSKRFNIEIVLRPEVKIFMEEASAYLGQYPVKVFCHRDYHSRNILLSDEGKLTLIDFQDARMGTPFYDLASLLYDAYRPIPFSMRQGLYLHFQRFLDPNLPKAKECFYLQCLQRSYKALGSYFMLVTDKGFDKYRISLLNCLENLLEIVQVGLFPDHLFVFFHLLRKELMNDKDFMSLVES